MDPIEFGKDNFCQYRTNDRKAGRIQSDGKTTKFGARYSGKKTGIGGFTTHYNHSNGKETHILKLNGGGKKIKPKQPHHTDKPSYNEMPYIAFSQRDHVNVQTECTSTDFGKKFSDRGRNGYNISVNKPEP